MDTEIERSEAELNSFLDRQAAKVAETRAGQEWANQVEAELKRGDERRAAQMREQNRWEWVRHFERLARNHAAISEMYASRAEKLIQRGDDAA